MKILITSYYFPPIPSVASERILGFADSLSRSGHEVEVLTTTHSPTSNDAEFRFKVVRIKSSLLTSFERQFAFLRQPGTNSEKLAKRGLLQALNSFRIRRGIGYLGRMPDVTDLWYLSARTWLARQTGWDLVISSYAPYSSHLLANYAVKTGKADHWIADYRDLWIDHHLFKGLPPFTLLEKYLDRRIAKQASHVTLASEAMAKRYQQRYPATRTSVIYNGYRDIPDTRDVSDIQLSESDFNIGYFGTLYPSIQNIQPLWQALQTSGVSTTQGHQNITVNMVGGIPHYVIKSATDYNLESKVRIIPTMAYPEARSLMLKMDLLLLIDSQLTDYDGIIPVKLFDYMASHRPILFLTNNPDSEAAGLAKQSGTAFVLMNNSDVIASFIEKYKTENLSRDIDSGSAFIEQFNRQAQNSKLEKLAQSLLKI